MNDPKRNSILSVSMFAVLLAAQFSITHAAGTVVYAGYGGKFQAKIKKAVLAPSAAKLGLKVLDEAHKNLPSVRIQVQSGKPSWDIIQLGSEECAIGEKEGLFETLDRSVISFDGIPISARGKSWVGINFYSIVLAWRKDKFGNNPPKNWADFWNVEKFPGTRSLPAYASGTLEVALMADGVSRDAMYPLDVNRALGVMRKIAPHVSVWWRSGAQSAQLLKDGEVDLMMIWGSRIAAVLGDGANVDFTYQDAILGVGCLAIPKGAPNAALAQKMIGLMISPKMQANIPKVLGYYGPVNEKAFSITKFSDDVLRKSNSSPENITKQLLMDADWWRDNQIALRMDERYKEIIVSP